MASKKHITALGKPFDMSALQAKNEKIRAIGNMNVNARGDIIDSNNNIINDKNKRINTMYSKTMQTTMSAPVADNDVRKSELDEFDDEPNPIKK